MLHHAVGVWQGWNCRVPRTVNGDGHALSERVAICSYECGDSTQRVDLEIVLRNTLCRNGLDDLKVKLVRFGNRSDGRRARVTLKTLSEVAQRAGACEGSVAKDTHIVGVKLAETHGCI